MLPLHPWHVDGRNIIILRGVVCGQIDRGCVLGEQHRFIVKLALPRAPTRASDFDHVPPARRRFAVGSRVILAVLGLHRSERAAVAPASVTFKEDKTRRRRLAV